MARFRDDTNGRTLRRFPSYQRRAARLRFVATIGAAVITAAGLLLSAHLQSHAHRHDPPPREPRAPVVEVRPAPDLAPARGMAAATMTTATQAATLEPVYVTRTGRKYHRAACQHVDGRTTFELTVDEALQRGFEACRTCLPP